MRFAVEGWAPDYGSAMHDDESPDTGVEAEYVEGSAAEFAARSPAAGVEAPPALVFVDGVQRIEANVWVTDDEGVTHQGVCASYAAGAVRCDGTARVVATEVRRGLFCPAPSLEPIVTRHGVFAAHAVVGGDPTLAAARLGEQRDELEGAVATTVAGADLVVVDGRLKRGQRTPGYVGFVKTHWAVYGQPVVREVVATLQPGQRTPILRIDPQRPRYTWYLRLPCELSHGWAGVVRLETPADQPVADAVRLADQLCVALPTFASVPRKEPRAPQNLVPIAGLERDLRRRLGDPQLLLRALRVASAAA